MASAVKAKIARVTHRNGSDDEENQQQVDKYRVMVTAGPSYDLHEHKVVSVNTDEPFIVENEFLTAKISVRVRNFNGLPSSSPASCPYFDDPVHDRDLYSIAFTFVPKQDLPSTDTVWGNDFDHPIREKIPPGFNTAFRIVKEFIDPGLSCDAYADEPWLYGPSLSCWFAFRIGDKIEDGQDFPSPDNAEVLKEGADGAGQEVRDRLGLPTTGDSRRKFFRDAQNREKFVFEKGRCYQGDFYNPYIDFCNMKLKLPGFQLRVVKYVEDKSHCLRYVFKDRETGDVYFNVNFHLLWGQQLEDAFKMEEEKRTGQRNETLAAILLPGTSGSSLAKANANAVEGKVSQVETSPDDVD